VCTWNSGRTLLSRILLDQWLPALPSHCIHQSITSQAKTTTMECRHQVNLYRQYRCCIVLSEAKLWQADWPTVTDFCPTCREWNNNYQYTDRSMNILFFPMLALMFISLMWGILFTTTRTQYMLVSLLSKVGFCFQVLLLCRTCYT
jgi:hypothetical protein